MDFVISSTVGGRRPGRAGGGLPGGLRTMPVRAIITPLSIETIGVSGNSHTA